MFDIRHNERVRCITDVIRGGDLLVHQGQQGRVLALSTAPGPHNPKGLYYLVKWDRKHDPISVYRADIERVNKP